MDIHVGDEVTYCGRVLRVCGLSPMSVSPRRVFLEDDGTGEVVEVALADIEDDNGPCTRGEQERAERSAYIRGVADGGR